MNKASSPAKLGLLLALAAPPVVMPGCEGCDNKPRQQIQRRQDQVRKRAQPVIQQQRQEPEKGGELWFIDQGMR